MQCSCDGVTRASHRSVTQSVQRRDDESSPAIKLCVFFARSLSLSSNAHSHTHARTQASTHPYFLSQIAMYSLFFISLYPTSLSLSFPLFLLSHSLTQKQSLSLAAPTRSVDTKKHSHTHSSIFLQHYPSLSACPPSLRLSYLWQLRPRGPIVPPTAHTSTIPLLLSRPSPLPPSRSDQQALHVASWCCLIFHNSQHSIAAAAAATAAAVSAAAFGERRNKRRDRPS